MYSAEFPCTAYSILPSSRTAIRRILAFINTSSSMLYLVSILLLSPGSRNSRVCRQFCDIYIFDFELIGTAFYSVANLCQKLIYKILLPFTGYFGRSIYTDRAVWIIYRAFFNLKQVHFHALLRWHIVI